MTGKPLLVTLAIILAAVAGFFAGRESLRYELRRSLVDAISSPEVTLSEAPTALPRVPASWQVRADSSAMDDSRMVMMSLKADSAVGGWANHTELPTLIIRCKEGKTDFYIVNGTSANVEYGLSDQATIRLRLDSDDPVKLVWGESTDGEALFAPNPIPLARGIVNGTKLTYEFTPFRESPAQFSFTITGIRAPLQQIANACQWKL